MNLTSVQEITHMELWLGMITTPYCYDKFKPSDEENDCHVNDVVEKDEQGEPINQIMRPYVPKFEDTSGFAHMMRFDWALSHRNSDLHIELEVGQMF
jgi:hypothetical protein